MTFTAPQVGSSSWLKDSFVANVIALAALAQPWIYWVWKKYFRTGRIDIHETAKVEVGYSGLGATIALYGTLRSVHEDEFVRSIELLVTRIPDNMQRRYEWLAFRPATIVIGGPGQTELEIASGFMLLTSQPRKYNIIFVDPVFQAQVISVTQVVRTAWATFVAQNGVSGANINALFHQFRMTPDHVTAYTALDRMLDWRPVEYAVDVRVNTANPENTFSRRLGFALTAQDVANLRSNCFRIIEESCGIPTTGPYSFAYCDYARK